MNSSTGSTNGQGSGAPFQWPFQGVFSAGLSSFMNALSDVAHGGFSVFNGLVPKPVMYFIAQASTRALNHLLRQKPSAATHLAKHTGQIFSIVLAVGEQKITLTWVILPDGLLAQHVQADASSTEVGNLDAPEAQQKVTPNTTIHFNMADVLQGLPKRDAIKRKVRIEGDVELAQSVSTAMNQLEWDIEADLANIVGDTPAVWLMQSMQWTQEQLQYKWNSICDAFREYWVYETRLLPNTHDYQQWLADIAHMRDDVARLEKRIMALETLRKAQLS